MSIREGLKTVEQRCIKLLRWFLRAALFSVLLAVLVARGGGDVQSVRYLLILAVILACQGVWGAVLLDCVFRRFGKKQ